MQKLKRAERAKAGATATPTPEKPAEEIRQLIPDATAMTPEDFEKVLAEGESLKAPVGEVSLTRTFLRMRPPPANDPKRKQMDEEFAVTTGSNQLSARQFTAEIYGPYFPHVAITADVANFPAGPVTFVHADRICDVTCDVKGDTATGIVSYEVPKLYRGKFHYVASRKGGAWQITELSMPAWGIRLVRGEKGTWVQK